MVESRSKANDGRDEKSPKPPQPTSPLTTSSAETARVTESVPMENVVGATIPKQFGRYQIRKELGRGQMGTVYLANDVELDRLVALKVARSSASGSAKLIKRMEVEAKAAAKVDHPLICKVYDAGEIDGIRFIALQYIEGEELRTYLKRKGALEPKDAVRIVQLLIRALGAAHEKGVMHRDLKPENIMLNKRREPVIMDFGLARPTIGSSNAGLTQGMVVGTAAYMSPEQATGNAEEIDHRSDLYAVGVILFEMLTGQWPFTGGSIEVMGKKCVQEPPSVLDFDPTLPLQLAEVCSRLLAKRKEDRFRNCSEVFTALKVIDFDSPVATLESHSPLESHLNSDAFETLSPTLPPLPIKRKVSKNSDRVENEYRATFKESSHRPKLKAKRDSTTSVIIWSVVGTLIVGIVIGLFAIFQPGNGPAAHPVAKKMPGQDPSSTTINVTKVAKLEPKESSPPTLPATQEETAEETKSRKFNPQVDSKTPEPANRVDDPLPPEQIAEFENNSNETPEKSEPESEPEIVAQVPADSTAANSDLDGMIEQAGGLMQSKKPKEAIIVLKRASATFPQEIRPDFYLGLMYSGVGENDMKNAELFFKKALDRVPGHVATSNNLALVFIKERKFKSAWTFFTAASKDQRPSNVDQNLGRLQNQARILTAKKEDQKLIDGFKVNSANYRVDKGWFYMPVDDTAKMHAEYKPFCRNGNLEDQSCSFCNGEGSLKCPTCSGRRGVVVTGTATQTMRSELNPNAPIVLTSPTGGVVSCPTCGGKGRLDCSHCEKGHDPKLR